MFVANPRSGRGRAKKYLKEIVKFKEGLAREKGIEVDIECTEKSGPKTAFNLGKEAAEGGYDILVAVGGDGTINGIADGMVKSNIPPEGFPRMAVVRAGVGNDFAKGLGTPKGIDWVFKVLSQDEALIQDVSIDLGRVAWEDGDRTFINVFSLGVDAKINNFAADFKEKFHSLSFLPLFGEGMYLTAALLELAFCLHFEYPKVEIEMPGTQIVPGRVTLIAVANGSSYGAIFRIAPQAKMEDGLLDICQVGEMGRFKMFLSIPLIYLGTHLSLPEVATISDGKLPQAAFLTISSPENLTSQIDGEPLESKKKYWIGTLPKMLKVLVP
jgi:diacylglycerol kinase (ATP)